MKITRIGPDDIFHRYLTPKWAFLPVSGAGAAVDGGRFNRPGVEALICPVRRRQRSMNTGRAPALFRQPPLPLTRSHSPRWPTFRRDSTRTSGTALGRTGIVPGARSLASTRGFPHFQRAEARNSRPATLRTIPQRDGLSCNGYDSA